MKREKRMYWLIGLVITAALICSPKFTGATSTTNLLIADYGNNRVIEVEPLTHNVIWQYGEGVAGSGINQLNHPWEANKLINGNVLIADHFNHRVIEVQPSGTSGGTIVWQYGQTGISGNGTNQLNLPADVKKLANGNVLIADWNNHRVIEVQPTYPAGGNIVWQYSGGLPYEAERLADGSTLICRNNPPQLIRVSGTSSTILWSYTSNVTITDVEPLVNGNLLITEYGNHRVVELQPSGTSGGTIVWQYGQTGVKGSGVNQLKWPSEAIRLANGNTLIAEESNHRVIEVKTTDYPNWGTSSIVWQQGQTGVSGSGWNQLGQPWDVEEIWPGILNQVVVAYKDMGDISQPVVTAWVFTPVSPVVMPPVLEVTKTVSPSGTQTKGTVLTYTIGYTNTGKGTAKDVVVTDMVPSGTVYQTGSAQIASGPGGAITYSHDSGVTYDNSGAGLVTHIRWTIPDIGPGQTGILRFSVRIQ